MNILDRNVSWAADRSVRELIVLLGGVTLCTVEWTRIGGPDIGNFLVYVGATALFASRFYLARAVAVGACIGAIVQQWPHLRYGSSAADLETTAVLPVLAIALLCSRDLVARFDRGESRWSWLPNPWTGFTTSETRTLRWSCYAAGALGGLLDHTFQIAPYFAQTPTWPRVAMVAIICMIGLLGLGRAVGLLGIWAVGLWTAVALAPHLGAAERAIAGDLGGLDPAFWGGPHYVLPMFLLALTAVVVATPSAVRLIRRV